MFKFIAGGFVLLVIVGAIAGGGDDKKATAKVADTKITGFEHPNESKPGNSSAANPDTKPKPKPAKPKNATVAAAKAINSGRIQMGMTKAQVKAIVGNPESAHNSTMDLMGDTIETSMWTWMSFTEGVGVSMTFQDGKLESKSVSKY